MKKNLLAVLTTLLINSLLTLGNAEVGMVKVVNNSNFELGAFITFISCRTIGLHIINPNSTQPDLPNNPGKSLIFQ